VNEQIFHLPDVGEGLTEAEIVRWRVQPGDEVSVNDPILDIETAKAVVELPSPFAGVVDQLLVAEGQVVAVGTPVLSVTGQSILIGYGVMSDTASSPTTAATPATTNSLKSQHAVPARENSAKALAKPPVRALARSLGVNVNEVTPTGVYGDVTRVDVERHLTGAKSAGGQRIPVRGVQRTMAETMMRSVREIPQVTIWRDVDVSAMVQAMAALKEHVDWQGVRVTPMLFVASAIVHAVRRSPITNSTWHDLSDGSAEIEIHSGVDLAMAVAGPRGLVVPHIAGIDRMTPLARGAALATLTTRARDDLLTPTELMGGTITVTNVGVFGTDGGTPIVIPGQSAIIATGRIMERPWAISGGLTVRPVMTVSMAFDHRVVDGATGSAFLADLTDYLASPPTPLI